MTRARHGRMKVPKNTLHSAVLSVTGEVSLCQTLGTDDPARPTWTG